MITKEHHAMPCPENEICYLCGEEMFMTAMSYGGETTTINWKCKCRAIKTTKIEKECKMAVREGGLKLCKDCKFFRTSYGKCLKAPKGNNYVDGGMDHWAAWIERQYSNLVWWKCSKKGRFWEPREE